MRWRRKRRGGSVCRCAQIAMMYQIRCGGGGEHFLLLLRFLPMTRILILSAAGGWLVVPVFWISGTTREPVESQSVFGDHWPIIIIIIMVVIV